ncbi:MAG TPA: pilin [Candidatus Paceibacterota bacterium]
MRNKILVPVLLLILPSFASAKTIGDLLKDVGGWLGTLLPILTALALVVFIWGLVIFIGKAGDETARTEGKQRMIWGVIALFVIISIWGLVTFLQETTGTGGSSALPAPGLPAAPK